MDFFRDHASESHTSPAEFTADQSSTRLGILQSLCSHFGNGDNTCLVILPGLDGKYNGTSQAVIKYAMLGLSGTDLHSDTIDSKFEALEDAVVVISPDRVQLYYNFRSSKLVNKVVARWSNLLEFYATPKETAGDMSREEMYKIKSFVTMLSKATLVGIPQSNIDWGFDSTPCLQQWCDKPKLGGDCQVETWPLVQAYGLDDLETGGFLTRTKNVVDVSQEIHIALQHVDSVTLSQAIHDTEQRLALHWDTMCRYLGHYSVTRRSKLSETRIAEPLLSFYEFGKIRSSSYPDNETVPSSMRGTRLLFGPRTSNQLLESSDSEFIQSNQGTSSTVHCTVQAENPCNGIRVARTYMLDLAQTSETNDSKYVHAIYSALCQVHRMVLQEAVGSPSSGVPYLRDESRARATRRLESLARNLFQTRENGIVKKMFGGKSNVENRCDFKLEIDSFDSSGVSIDTRLLASNVNHPFPMRAYHYIKLTISNIPSTTDDNVSLGSIIIGDTIIAAPEAYATHIHTELFPEKKSAFSVSSSVPYVLTSCIPLVQSFATANPGDVAFVSNFGYHDVLQTYESSLGPKLNTSWQRTRASLFSGLYPEIAGGIECSLPAANALEGHVVLFEHGLVFESQAMGTYVLRLGSDVGSLVLLQLPPKEQLSLSLVDSQLLALAVVERRDRGDPKGESEWETGERKPGNFWDGPFKRLLDSSDEGIGSTLGCVALVLEDAKSLITLWESWKETSPDFVDCKEEVIFDKTPASQLFTPSLSLHLGPFKETRKMFILQDCLLEDLSNTREHIQKNATPTQALVSNAAQELLQRTRSGTGTLAIHLVVGIPGSGKVSVARAIQRAYQVEYHDSFCEIFSQDPLIRGTSFDVSGFRNRVSSCTGSVLVVTCPGAMTTWEFVQLVSAKKDLSIKLTLAACTVVVSAFNSYKDARNTQLLPNVQALCAAGWSNTICVTGCTFASDAELERLHGRLSQWNANARKFQVSQTGLEPFESHPIVLDPTFLSDTLPVLKNKTTDELDWSTSSNGFHCSKYVAARSNHGEAWNSQEHAGGTRLEAELIFFEQNLVQEFQDFTSKLVALTSRGFGKAAVDSLVCSALKVPTHKQMHQFGTKGELRGDDELEDDENKRAENDSLPTTTGIRRAQQLAMSKVKNNTVRNQSKAKSRETAEGDRSELPKGECWVVEGNVKLTKSNTTIVKWYYFQATDGMVYIQESSSSKEKQAVLFTGIGLQRKQLQGYFHVSDSHFSTEPEKATSYNELSVEQQTKLEEEFEKLVSEKPLPSGYWFDGRNYINYRGEIQKEHPSKSTFVQKWLENQ